MAGRKEEELKDLTLLGNQGTKYLFEYSPEVLEVFENKHPDRDYFVTHISHPPNENREDFFVPMSNESLTHKESEGVFLS